MGAKQSSRRKFLRNSAALAGLAATPAGLAVAPRTASGQTRGAGAVPDMNAMEYVLYGARSRFVTTKRILEGHGHYEDDRPKPNPYRPSVGTPIRDLVGIITPSSLHFATQHHYGIPEINPSEHTLTIHGMVDRPMVFTVDDLKRFPASSGINFLECLGNRPRPTDKNVNETNGRMACSEWIGVPLSMLLKEAGVKNGASWIVAEAAEAGHHTKSVPMAKVMDDVLVAYGQNGEPIRPDHGFPLRLLVPGFEGIYNVKWLKTIKVVDQPYKTFQRAVPVHGCRPAIAALHLRARAEVGHHVPIRRRPSAGARHLHDYRFGVVRRGRRPSGGGLYRRWANVDRRKATRAGVETRVRQVRPRLEVERRGGGAPVALHRRAGSGTAVGRRVRQILE